MFWPVVDGGVDGEDEVEQEDRQNEEVKGRIEARVVFEVLRSGHWILSELVVPTGLSIPSVG